MKKVLETIIVEGRDDHAAVCAAVDADIIITNGFKIRKPVAERIKMAAQREGIVVFTDPDFAGENIRRNIESLLHEAFEEGEYVIRHARLVREDALKDGDIGVENASAEAILHALQRAGATFALTATPGGIRSAISGEPCAACFDAPLISGSAQVGRISGVSESKTTAFGPIAEGEAAAAFATEIAVAGEASADGKAPIEAKNSADGEAAVGRERRDLVMTDLIRFGLAGEGGKALRTKVGRELGIGYANAKQFLIRLGRRGIGPEELEALIAALPRRSRKY